MAEDFDGIFLARVSAATLELQAAELDEAERGAIFVAWPRPPRVGSRVRIDLAFGDAEPEAHAAVVVMSRPARPGMVAGFRAQLASPPQEVLERLRGIVEVARSRVLSRDVGASRAVRRAAGELPIRERITAPSLQERQPARSGLIVPRLVTPPAPMPAARESDRAPAAQGGSLSLELPEDDLPFELEGGGLRAPPAPRAPGREEPSIDADGGLPGLDLDEQAHGSELARELKAEVVRDPEPPPPPTPARVAPPRGTGRAVLRAEPAPVPPRRDLRPPPRPERAPVAARREPVRIGFASQRTYLIHYERFLQRNELYITSIAALPTGTLFDVSIEVPDGEAPLAAQAIAEREVFPPEVPRAGWVATLVDVDGEVAERLATASFIVTTPQRT